MSSNFQKSRAQVRAEARAMAAQSRAYQRAMRPWWKRWLVWIPVGVIALALIGSTTDSEDTTAPAVAEVPAPEPAPVPAPAAEDEEDPAPAAKVAPTPAPEESFPMPDVVGMNLQAAQDLIQSDAGIMVSLSHDVRSDRMQLNDRGWKVCEQNVDPGTLLTSDDEGLIDLGVVRTEETCS